MSFLKMKDKVGAPVAWAMPPMFEYETNEIRTDAVRLDQYLNAKAANGWRLHTCQKVSEGCYFVVLDKIKREER